MKRIVIASKNPVKLRAALGGFQKLFPAEQFELVSVDVPSEVSRQPMGDEETLLGALNRAWNAVHAHEQADYWVGIEGGVSEHDCQLMAFAWVVVCDRQAVGKARSAAFLLPEPVAGLIRAGKELGEADDIVFGRSNSKQEDGAIGLLTDNAIDRAGLYEPAMVMALLPFRHPEMYLKGC